MFRASGVYHITTKDGKEYIGQAKNMHKRIHAHFRKRGSLTEKGYTVQSIASVRTHSIGNGCAMDAVEDALIRIRHRALGGFFKKSSRLLSSRFQIAR
ncbi:GIY-YIG nuclease family protein [Cellulosimicrobium sp. AB352]|uniref:GIY-YIG nuclease family protein n=1 Tax=unclassified Cellulosimicrobium TaxID=2624466 RepID=UPI0035304DD7